MSAISYVRYWCTTCLRATTHRRDTVADAPNGKLECMEHGPHARSNPIDWVDVAIRAASGHAHA